MPRPEKVINTDAGPLHRFAHDLRELRRGQGGGLPYREMAKRANYSSTVLSEAAAGRKLPTLPVTMAYVRACGGDADEWGARWRSVAEEIDGGTATSEVEPSVRTLPRSHPSSSVGLALVGATVLAVVAVLTVWAFQRPEKPVTPQDMVWQDFDAIAGDPVPGEPPAGAPCSVHAKARACLDEERKVMWVKDLPPSDGHHVAVYWTSTDRTKRGDCHNYLGSDGLWVTCPYPDVGNGGKITGLQVAIVEKEKILEWGPYVSPGKS
jgi:hypothetical protein